MSSISRLESIYTDLENKMLEQAKQSDSGKHVELLDRVSTLLQQLDGHEKKEHQFAVDILGARADGGS